MYLMYLRSWKLMIIDSVEEAYWPEVYYVVFTIHRTWGEKNLFG